MPRLQGLIFDLDGTLVDSAPDLRQALNRMLVAHGRRTLELEEVKGMTGDGLMPMMNRAFAATGAPIADSDSYACAQEFISYYRSQKADPAQIYPGVLEALQTFHREDIRMGICTNKQEAATLGLIEQLNLARYFDFIAGGDTFPVHKPHPGHVQGVLEKLGVPAANAAMVGDSSNDVLAAKGAGIPCLVVMHGYGRDIGGLNASGVIVGFQELRRALAGLGFELV